MNDPSFIYKRHSVRKFKNKDVPTKDIEKIVKAATHAPSGKNLQNWHFVVLKNKDKIKKIAKIVEDKNANLANSLNNPEKSTAFAKYVKYHTVFKNAPVVILIYAGPYPNTGEDILIEKGATKEEIYDLAKTSPGIQNIGAAMENLLLTAANIGYGGCWMTSPNYAAKEIEEFIGFKEEGYYLAAMTPLGIPEESELKSPPRKPIDQVMTIIE